MSFSDLPKTFFEGPVLFHQLPQHLVFLPQPGFQKGDALLAGLNLLLRPGRGFKSCRAVLEELFQPARKEAGVEVLFLTKVRDLNLFDQVSAEHGDLLLGGEILTFVVVHDSSPLSLS
jgi:hypothetical protein